MRRIATITAGVLAVLLLPLALLSSWVAGVVTDTDRYVSTVRPLASDPEVQRAVVRLLERQGTALVERAAADAGLEEFLRARGFGSVSDRARAKLAGVIRVAATAIVESPEFPRAWASANRSAHEQLVAVLEGDEDAVIDTRGRVSLELGTLLNTLGARLQAQGLLPAGLPAVQASFTLVKAEDLSRAEKAYRVLDALGFWLPLLWLLGLAAALVLARDRPGALRRQGAAAVVTMAVLVLGLWFVRGRLAAASPDDAVVRAIWDVLTRDLRRAAWTGLALGVGCVLVPLALTRRRTGRTA